MKTNNDYVKKHSDVKYYFKSTICTKLRTTYLTCLHISHFTAALFVPASCYSFQWILWLYRKTYYTIKCFVFTIRGYTLFRLVELASHIITKTSKSTSIRHRSDAKVSYINAWVTSNCSLLLYGESRVNIDCLYSRRITINNNINSLIYICNSFLFAKM